LYVNSESTTWSCCRENKELDIHVEKIFGNGAAFAEFSRTACKKAKVCTRSAHVTLLKVDGGIGEASAGRDLGRLYAPATSLAAWYLQQALN